MNDRLVRSTVLVAAFTALIIVGAIFSFPAPWNPLVPFTMATLFVILSGMLLGPLRGAAAVGLYLLLGVIGLPVFAGGSGGAQVLAGPTGGFLAGYLLAAVLAGMIARAGRRTTVRDTGGGTGSPAASAQAALQHGAGAGIRTRVESGRGTLAVLILAAAAGTLAIYLPGLPWMHYRLTGLVEDWSWASTWGRYTAPFLIGDGLKAAAAVIVARALKDRIA